MSGGEASSVSAVGRYPYSGKLEADFWKRVDMRAPDECWPWLGGRTNDYGCVSVEKRARLAHRVAWELTNRKAIPPHLVARHKCDNPICVNPAHIIPGSVADNNRDIIERGRHGQKNKTHCRHGHEYTPENIYRTPTGRDCRTCRRDRLIRFKAARKSASQ